jgi:tetratricopeptide (TPR) repeat protein
MQLRIRQMVPAILICVSSVCSAWAQESGNQAQELMKQGKFQEAIPYWTKTIDILKEHPKELKPEEAKGLLEGAYCDRGLCYENLHQHEAAVMDYCLALMTVPNDPDVLVDRGNAYRHLKQYQQAIMDLNDALRFHYSKPMEVYSNLATVYLGSGDMEKALENCNKAIELDPKAWVPYQTRSQVYGKMGKNELANQDREKAKQLGFVGQGDVNDF